VLKRQAGMCLALTRLAEKENLSASSFTAAASR
jgi:hypothetical protein